MVLDSILTTSSPLIRRQPSRRQFAKHEMGSWSTLLRRHRFLLYAIALLTVLCSIYLYFAVTFVANGSCSGLSGPLKEACDMEHAKASVPKSLRHL